MELARLETRLDRALDEHGFSGVVDIRRGGTVVYARASGPADRSRRIPNTLETRFGIASGTKFLTALAIGKLIDTGQLSFSTRLRDCLPLEFPRYSPDITLRHLLTHTSGVPDYYDEEKVKDVDSYTVGLPWSALRGPRDYLAVFPDEDMKFEPGKRFSYSNGGYILLGLVIEEATGMEYRDFVEQAILGPAGMTRSGYFAMDRLPGETALGYVDGPSGWRANTHDLPIVGASDGGAFTTADDFARLWTAFLAHEIVSRELVEIYTTPYVKAETEGPNTYSGHGLWVDEPPGGRRVYTTGCDAGVSFQSGVRLAADVQVTVLSNTTRGAWPVLRTIDDALEESAGPPAHASSSPLTARGRTANRD